MANFSESANDFKDLVDAMPSWFEIKQIVPRSDFKHKINHKNKEDASQAYNHSR